MDLIWLIVCAWDRILRKYRSNKAKFDIPELSKCFDINITFQFYDSNDNLIICLVVYRRGVKSIVFNATVYIPIETTCFLAADSQSI